MDSPESSFSGEALGVLVETKMSMSRQGALAPKKTDCVLCCVGRNVGRRLVEVITPWLFSVWLLHLECCVQFWVPQETTTEIIKFFESM